ncbi:MAG: hypothetical protein ACP5IE_01345 [Infirmifilum sp.]
MNENQIPENKSQIKFAQWKDLDVLYYYVQQDDLEINYRIRISISDIPGIYRLDIYSRIFGDWSYEGYLVFCKDAIVAAYTFTGNIEYLKKIAERVFEKIMERVSKNE